jgi:hypothetical protein
MLATASETILPVCGFAYNWRLGFVFRYRSVAALPISALAFVPTMGSVTPLGSGAKNG